MEKALFGPAGSPQAFSLKYRTTLKMPGYLKEMGLDCFEYQCGRGVNIGKEACIALGKQAEKCGIRLSLHSPYFINLSSDEPQRMEKNVGHILESAQACFFMGGDRVVVHCGGLSGRSREEAFKNTLLNIDLALEALDRNGLSGITLCVETMGKINVLGDLEEVLELCRLRERLLPCVDFGHLNCRTFGGMNSEEDFARALDMAEDIVGSERAKSMHIHFSKIEYSKGGEVKHLTFEDSLYGPDFSPLGRLMAKRGYAPRVICESAGTQDTDALEMKDIYFKYLNEEEKIWADLKR